MTILALVLDGATVALGGSCFVVGLALTWVWSRSREKALAIELDRKEQALRDEMQQSARELEESSREELEQLQARLEEERQSLGEELKDTRRELDDLQKDLDKKERSFGKREKKLREQENEISRKESRVQQRLEELERVLGDEKEQLLTISDMTRDEARELLLRQIESDVESEKADIVHRVVEETRSEADAKARELIAEAMVRCASEQTAATTVSTVDLPSDDMKGRIIGREGRNIKAFERITGIDVIVDDTPGVVVLSGFDAVRREVAVLSMKKLLGDGRIHPARIEDVVKSMRKEVEKRITEIGHQAVLDLNVSGIQARLHGHVGRLQFKVVGGQDLLAASKTTASLMGVMASEFDLDSDRAKMCGLLAHIGLTESQEIEGTAAHVGSQMARRFGCPQEVVQAIASVGTQVEPSNLYGVLLQVATRIVRARPGASHDQVQRYVKRLEKIESIATSLEGVREAFAIQAGNELRVVVDPIKVKDKMAVKMARDIARKIEAEASYPGTLTVNLLRESRSVSYAR